MYLEEITYYKNMCCPQFTPINYLFDREYCFDNDNAKAVMLSELPAIFKKYNIPLCRDDLLLFLNPKDNIASGYDLGCVIDGIDSQDPDERRDALLTKDFIEFFRKIEYIDFSNNDNLIYKAINERYGYHYNKRDENKYEKFKQYLTNNIPKNGFYNVELLTDKDFQETEMSWLDYKVQDFRYYFWDIKTYYNDARAKILSERFFRIYDILKDKYGEIKFSNIALNKDGYSIIDRASSLYLNDIIYEKSPKRFYKDYVTYINYNPSIYDDFPKSFSRVYDNERWQEYKKRIHDDFFKHKKMWFDHVDKIGDIIDVLEAERVILEQNGYKDAVTLLPVLFQDYFRFALKYEKEIEFFKRSLGDTSNRAEALTSLISYYGMENVRTELISYLNSDKYIDHHTIKKVKTYKKQ